MTDIEKKIKELEDRVAELESNQRHKEVNRPGAAYDLSQVFSRRRDKKR